MLVWLLGFSFMSCSSFCRFFPSSGFISFSILLLTFEKASCALMASFDRHRVAGCTTCPILTATNKFTSHTNCQKFKMKFVASCKSSNIVNLITCRRCGQQYMGKTGQLLYRRAITSVITLHIRGLQNLLWLYASVMLDTFKCTWLSL